MSPSIKLIPDCALSTSSKRLCHLKAIARANCKNETSEINFNKYGDLDNIGLTPASDYFIDTVIFKYTLRESDNDLSVEENLRIYYHKLHAIILCNGNGSPDFTLLPIPTKEHESFFKWRLACPNMPLNIILSILNCNDVQNTYIVLSVDITRDFAGSFQLDDMVGYFKTHHGMQEGYSESGLFYEKDMMNKTGNYFSYYF